MKKQSFILYEGPSVLDGAPIVCIATFGTKNRKTGAMVQTWILRSDINPVEALKTKQDSSVCGNCPLKQSVGGACYVNVGQAPNAVYKAYKAGKYPTLTQPQAATMLAGAMVRLGAYGDPAAIPVSVWDNALSLAAGNTGYTHQINHKNFNSSILKYTMASADTVRQAQGYHATGYRTFRVVTDYNRLLAGEIICPSDTDGTSCAACGLCASALADKPNIAIMVHGNGATKHKAKYSSANNINLIEAVNI